MFFGCYEYYVWKDVLFWFLSYCFFYVGVLDCVLFMFVDMVDDSVGFFCDWGEGWLERCIGLRGLFLGNEVFVVSEVLFEERVGGVRNVLR